MPNQEAMMKIQIKKDEMGTVVSVKGKMDAVSSPEFDKEMKRLIEEHGGNVIIDLGELNYISSSGLRSILAAGKDLKEKGGSLLLASLTDMVKEVFEISGFSSIIPIYESVESALKNL